MVATKIGMGSGGAFCRATASFQTVGVFCSTLLHRVPLLELTLICFYYFLSFHQLRPVCDALQ